MTNMIAVMSDALDILFAPAPLHRWPDGATLLHAGDAPSALYRVTRGRVLLRRSLADGAVITLQDAFPGDVLAEASAYAERYHCSAVAAGETEARALPLTAFRARIARDPLLAAGWAAHLARAVQSARFRIEVRSLPTVRARLDAWLSDGHALPGKGHMQDVAAEIGVSREALYRELSRRRVQSAARAAATTSAS
jgi:CRP-like cAMP-binding protein